MSDILAEVMFHMVKEIIHRFSNPIPEKCIRKIVFRNPLFWPFQCKLRRLGLYSYTVATAPAPALSVPA